MPNGRKLIICESCNNEYRQCESQAEAARLTNKSPSYICNIINTNKRTYEGFSYARL